jgi:hypothetical protein|tara:strand:+ start:8991 stop:9428 length:438 start_codon:yes stop_codon:yes gene_type:complete
MGKNGKDDSYKIKQIDSLAERLSKTGFGLGGGKATFTKLNKVKKPESIASKNKKELVYGHGADKGKPLTKEHKKLRKSVIKMLTGPMPTKSQRRHENIAVTKKLDKFLKKEKKATGGIVGTKKKKKMKKPRGVGAALRGYGKAYS